MEQGHQKEPTISQQVEELKRKVEETRQAAEEIKAREEEKKGILIKEIADMVEGNEKLGRIVQQGSEYARGYKDIDQKQMDTIEELKREIRYAEETIGSLGQDDVPQEDIQRLRESMSGQKDDISALESRLKEAADLHNKFMDEQKEANGNTLEFAVDAFMKGGLAPEMDEESKNALKAGVLNEIKRRQEEEEKERARENVKETIKQYGAIIEEVKKEFEALQETIGKGLEEFGEYIKEPKLLREVAGEIQEIKKKHKKIGSFFSYESKRWRLRDEINGIKGNLQRVYGNLWKELNDITSKAENFLRQQKGDYDYGRGEKRLGTIGEPYRSSYMTPGEVDPELKAMSDEKVKERDKLLRDIGAYVYEIKQKWEQYLQKIEKIIPEHFRNQ